MAVLFRRFLRSLVLCTLEKPLSCASTYSYNSVVVLSNKLHSDSTNFRITYNVLRIMAPKRKPAAATKAAKEAVDDVNGDQPETKKTKATKEVKEAAPRSKRNIAKKNYEEVSDPPLKASRSKAAPKKTKAKAEDDEKPVAKKGRAAKPKEAKAEEKPKPTNKAGKGARTKQAAQEEEDEELEAAEGI